MTVIERDSTDLLNSLAKMLMDSKITEQDIDLLVEIVISKLEGGTSDEGA